jgi:hypothetical protein
VAQLIFDLAGGFSIFTAALCDAAVDLGMLTAPPAGQNVQSDMRVSNRAIVGARCICELLDSDRFE